MQCFRRELEIPAAWEWGFRFLQRLLEGDRKTRGVLELSRSHRNSTFVTLENERYRVHEEHNCKQYTF